VPHRFDLSPLDELWGSIGIEPMTSFTTVKRVNEGPAGDAANGTPPAIR
jgi:hypothetical protein